MRYRRWGLAFLAYSLGTVWLAGCVTDAAMRDFLTSTLVRTFYQALAAVVQASIVGAQG